MSRRWIEAIHISMVCAILFMTGWFIRSLIEAYTTGGTPYA